MKNLTKYLFTLIIAILATSANVFACDPSTDPSCTETTNVFGNIEVGFNRTHGDAVNGGFQGFNGNLCATSDGNVASGFNGKIESTAQGAYDGTTGTSFSKANMTIAGTATNNVGTSTITGMGAVTEGSYVARGNNSDYYTLAGQWGGATLNSTTTTTTTQRDLTLNANLNAEGTAGSTFTVDGANKGITAFANNLASGTTTAFASNQIGGGVLNPNASAEFGGTAAITCPGGTVATNGLGSAAITQTDIANGFKLAATVTVTENVTKQP